MDAVVTEFEDETELAPGDRKLDAIDRLANTELHDKVRERLRDRIKMAKRKIEKLHTRWTANEHRFQAYMRSEDLEDLLNKSNERGTPPETTVITVPYAFATTMTTVTYLLHAFCGRNPMFPVGSYSGKGMEPARKMETLLQFNADYDRVIRKLYQFFMDGEMYGMHAMRLTWKVKRGRRTRFKEVQPNMLFLPGLTPQTQRVQEEEVLFEGNELLNIDPFRFYPDPRVPMDKVAEHGEFVFWRVFEGRHVLKKAEAAGTIKYLDKVETRAEVLSSGGSDRGRLAEGEEVPGRDEASLIKQGYYQLDQGTVEIIPSEWGLAENDQMEKWIFTLANDSQIIQAEPLDADHDLHPVVVGEPYSVGYGFGNIAMLDMLGPMQDTLSWLLNSHIYNVRTSLNNQLVVNPQLVDMTDLKRPAPGRVIKLLPAAFGIDPKMAVSQLNVADVTSGHIQDMQVVQRIGDTVSAINDNLRGQPQAGGRKTATETRMAGETGASRLGAHTKLISAQSINPMAEMMTLNIQQRMSMPFQMSIAGDEYHILPEDLNEHFYFQVHDGTLPMDRVGLMEVWKEILLAMFQMPQFGARYDVDGIFQYVAELGGAKNLSQFKVQVAPPGVDPATMGGNVVPLGRGAPLV